MRHLVLEGPDGGGKSRLAEAIHDKFPGMVIAEKASSSLRGPVKNLAAWVSSQFRAMDTSIPCRIYDRHPVISEPIYGPITRGQAQPGFSPGPWLSTARLNMYSRTFVIWCIPELEDVQKAVTDDRDMPGVAENIETIYTAYLREMKQWSGRGVRYNFSIMPSRDVLPSGLFSGAVQFVEYWSALLKAETFNG